jgi:hypothetical protein
MQFAQCHIAVTNTQIFALQRAPHINSTESIACITFHSMQAPMNQQCHIASYKHTEPQTASSATLSLSTESRACITVRSSQALRYATTLPKYTLITSAREGRETYLRLLPSPSLSLSLEQRNLARSKRLPPRQLHVQVQAALHLDVCLCMRLQLAENPRRAAPPGEWQNYRVFRVAEPLVAEEELPREACLERHGGGQHNQACEVRESVQPLQMVNGTDVHEGERVARLALCEFLHMKGTVCNDALYFSYKQVIQSDLIGRLASLSYLLNIEQLRI